MNEPERHTNAQEEVQSTEADHFEASQVKNDLSKLTRQLFKTIEKDLLIRNIQSDSKAFFEMLQLQAEE